MARYALGQPIRLSTTIRDVTGVLVAAGTLTLTLQKPNATQQVYPSPTNDGVGLYHQDVPAGDLTQLGAYQYEWVATGAGAGVIGGTFTVYDPLAHGLVWSPTLEAVAGYVPARTVPIDTATDDPLGTFDSTTVPDASQAYDKIAAAVGWVTARAGTVDVTLYQQAGDVAALRAAGLIELSYPIRDADINTAEQLLKLADQALTSLVTANTGVTGTEPGLDGIVRPVYSFPDPVAWGDLNL